jgi:hypothetical protein
MCVYMYISIHIYIYIYEYMHILYTKKNKGNWEAPVRPGRGPPNFFCFS